MIEVKGSLELSESAADVAPAGLVRLACKGGKATVSVNGGDYSELALADNAVESVTGDGFDESDPANPTFSISAAIADDPAGATAELDVATTSLPGLESAADKTKLDSLPSATKGVRQTVTGSAAQNITFTGLDGDNDGGYKIRGNLRTTASAPDITLWFNGADPDSVGSSGVFAHDASSTPVGMQLKPNLYIGSNITTEASDISFTIEVSSKHGEVGQFKCQTFSERASGTKCIAYATEGKFNMAANITSVSIHSGAAGTIDVGSYAVLQKLGVTA